MDAVVEEGAPAAAPPKPMTRLKLEDGLITKASTTTTYAEGV